MTAADAASPYRVGFVVVQRTWQPIKMARHKRSRVGFTLHRDDCHWLTKQGRNIVTMPAPAEAYPDTVPCAFCRPEDPHRYLVTEQSDSIVAMACSLCDIKVTAPRLKGAASKMHRLHEGRRAEQEMADALAKGAVERVITPRNGTGYTLHRVSCYYVARSTVARPVTRDEDIPEPTQGCELCKPKGAAIPKRANEADLTAKPEPGFTIDRNAHQIAHTKFPDGTYSLACSCGLATGSRPNYNSAKSALRRRHESRARAQINKRQRTTA